jgi:hypothetical protein
MSQTGSHDHYNYVPQASDITYIALASNPNNDKEIQETRKFLNEKIVDKTESIITFKAPDRTMYVWGCLTLHVAALEEVRAHPGITHAEEELEE